MQRHHLAVIFLLLFLQAVMYPVAIFAIYVEFDATSEMKSLPADFPDNGNACFFGFSNNEEEKNVEESAFYMDDFCFDLELLLVVDLTNTSRLLAATGLLSHSELTTPPPEQF